MKKIILVLALILLIALPIFAQEEQQPTLNWYAAFFTATYFNFLYNNGGITVNRDYYGLDIDLSYDGLTYGIEAELEWFFYRGNVANFESSLGYLWNYMYGWFDLFGGMVTVYAGNQINSVYSPTPLAAYTVFGDAYTTGYGLGQYHTGYSGGKDGFVITATPIAGLSIALYINAGLDAGGTGGALIEDYMSSAFELNAKYSISGIGTIYAGIDLDVADSITTDNTDNALGFYAAFKFTGVKNLIAQIKYENVADDGNYIYGGAYYKFDFGLRAAFDFNLYLPTAGDSSWWLNAMVGYVTGNWLFGVLFDLADPTTSAMLMIPQIVYYLDGGYVRFRYYYYMNDYSTAYDSRIRIDYVLYF